MADPLSIISGLSAGLQLISAAAQALLTIIKFIKDLKEVPERLAITLNDIDDSISRLYYSCNAGTEVFKDLDAPKLARLSQSAFALYPALQDIHQMLMPLAVGSGGSGRSVRRLWRSLMSLRLKRDLLEKLNRLNRLNLEMIRELGVINLEVQLTTTELVKMIQNASNSGFAQLGIRMDSLRDDFQKLKLSVNSAHNVTIEHLAEGDEAGPQEQEQQEYSVCGKNSSRSGANSIINSHWTLEIPPERESKMRQYLTRESIEDTTPLSPSLVLTGQLPIAQLDVVLFSIRTFYTIGNFDSTSNTGINSHFWKNTDLAIYLLKISKGSRRGSSRSQTRAFRLLKSSTANMSTISQEGMASFLIEVFSTLSPTNTSICTNVRDALLCSFATLAHGQLPKTHPVALILHTLQRDCCSPTAAATIGDISFINTRALTFIAERLRHVLGPAHALTQFATERLCALLRRNGDYTEALSVARAGVRALRGALGPGSLPERLLLREVGHVHMERGDWAAALSVCFDVVGQSDSEAKEPDPAFHDECSIYTMEDIAETCERAANLELAVAWLKQAWISGALCWGKGSEALSHVQDKLEELLTIAGKDDELVLWKELM